MTDSNNTHETQKDKINAQRDYCRETGAPMFAPAGNCWSCHRDPYSTRTVAQCRKSLITGCPHCMRSYCD